MRKIRKAESSHKTKQDRQWNNIFQLLKVKSVNLEPYTEQEDPAVVKTKYRPPRRRCAQSTNRQQTALGRALQSVPGGRRKVTLTDSSRSFSQD